MRDRQKNNHRPDDAVIVPTFDRDAPIEKSTYACRRAVLPSVKSCYAYTYSNLTTKDDIYGKKKESGIVYTYGSATFGICNQGNANVYARIVYDNDTRYFGAGWRYKKWTNPIGVGRYLRWFGLSYSGRCTPTGNNTICIPRIAYKLQGYGFGGRSNDYDLVGARIASSRYVGGSGCVAPPIVR